MPFYSGNFTSNTGIVQLSSTRDTVNVITFFGIKSFNSGAAVNNVSGYVVGVTPTELPYVVNSGQPLTLTFANNDTRQNVSNFYIRGASGEGYYVITY